VKNIRAEHDPASA